MDEETKTVEQTEQQTTETVGDAQNPGGAGLTFDQMLDSNPAYRSEFDRRNVKAVETARKKWEAAQVEEQDEAKKLEKMTAAQRERYQLDKDRAAFDAQKASFAAEQMRVTVGAELQKRGLDASFAKYLSGKTAEESTPASLQKYSQQKRKERAVTVYGMINVRTDGEKVIIAQKLEQPAARSNWDIHRLEWNEDKQAFEYILRVE